MKFIFKSAVAAFLLASLFSAIVDIGGDIFGIKNTPLPSLAEQENLTVTKNAEDGDFVSVAAMDDGGTSFIIRETGGKVGIFAEGSDTPEYTLDIYIFTLPEKAAALLRDGIVCDAEGLSYLIESLTS